MQKQKQKKNNIFRLKLEQYNNTDMIIIVQHISWPIYKSTYNVGKMLTTKFEKCAILVFLVFSNDSTDVYYDSAQWMLCNYKTTSCISSDLSGLKGLETNLAHLSYKYRQQ